MNLDEKKLLKYFRDTDVSHQKSLLDFAEHLFEKYPFIEEQKTALSIERPEEESVVAALKRLKRSYPMLDSTDLLGKSSDLMSQHLLQGRDKKSTIDELEKLFEQTYAKFKQ